MSTSTENISIAIAYFNRLPQTKFTLDRLLRFGFQGVIVIADDHSETDQCAEILVSQYADLIIKVVYPTKMHNPAYVYNTAFAKCTKENVIIQNPECVWVHDIGQYVANHLKDNGYLVFGCLNGSEEDCSKFNELQT